MNCFKCCLLSIISFYILMNIVDVALSFIVKLLSDKINVEVYVPPPFHENMSLLSSIL